MNNFLKDIKSMIEEIDKGNIDVVRNLVNNFIKHQDMNKPQEILEGVKNARNKYYILYYISEGLIKGGRIAEAKAVLVYAIDIVGEMDLHEDRFVKLGYLVELLYSIDDKDGARKAVKKAMDIIEELKDNEDKFEAIAAISQTLANARIEDEGIWKNIIDAALNIKKQYYRSATLFAIAEAAEWGKIADESMWDRLIESERIFDEDEKTYISFQIAKSLGSVKILKKDIWDKLIALVEDIENKDYRLWVLSKISEELLKIGYRDKSEEIKKKYEL